MVVLSAIDEAGGRVGRHLVDVDVPARRDGLGQEDESLALDRAARRMPRGATWRRRDPPRRQRAIDRAVEPVELVVRAEHVARRGYQPGTDAANGDLVRGGGVATLEGVQPGRHAGEPGALRAHAPLHV